MERLTVKVGSKIFSVKIEDLLSFISFFKEQEIVFLNTIPFEVYVETPQ